MNNCIVCGFNNGYCEFCPRVPSLPVARPSRIRNWYLSKPLPVDIEPEDVEELADRLSCPVYWRGSVDRQVKKLREIKT